MSNHGDFDPSRRNLLLGAATGGALASLASITAPLAAQAAKDSQGPIFYTQNEGIRPDHKGAADALAELLTRAPTGSVILFEPGSYDLRRWPGFILSKSITLLAHPHTVTLRGPGIGKENKYSFVTIGNTSVKGLVHVSIEGLSFEKWGSTIAAHLSSPIESLSVRRCSFDSIGSGVHATMSGSTANGRINHVTIEDCDFRNLSATAISVKALFRSAYVLRNRISDGRRSGISLGNTMPPNRVHEDHWKKAVVSHNICTNLLTPKEGADIHGIIVAGREIIVTQNHIEKVENGGGFGAEGIYAKARYADISHNTLVDAGYKEAAITLKGRPRVSKKTTPGGFANRICNNSIISRRLKPFGLGIVSYHGDMLISNNYLENLEGGIRTGSRQNDDRVLITGNLIRGVDRTGIQHAGTGSNIAVIGNSISLAKRAIQHGIMLKPTIREGEVPTDWVVKDNSIQGDPAKDLLSGGISLYCNDANRSAPLDGLVISNNQLSGLRFGIWSKKGNSPKYPKNGAWIHGNYFRQCNRDVAAVFSEDQGNVIMENNLSRRTSGST